LSRRHDPYAALRYKPYRWFIVSLFAMTLASQMRAVVVGWQIYALTHDPLSLGLIGLAEVVPFVGCALFAGHLADVANRRRISLIALSSVFVCSGALLTFTSIPGFLARFGPWPIYAVIFASGIARSFLQPARQAMGAELVPRELFASAVAWRSSTWQTAAVAGPALGGLLYGFFGPRAAYGVDLTLSVIAVTTFTMVAYTPTARAAAAATMEGLLGGIRFVLKERVIFAAMSLDLFSVFLAGSEALLPIYAAEILHVGPQGLGVLRAAPAAGAVVTSLVLAHRPPMQRAGRTMLIAVALFAACIVVFGSSRSFWLSLTVLAVSGMADTVSVVIRSTLIQVFTPTNLYGRVTAVNSIFIGSSNELGAFESGVMAKLLGTVTSVVVGGLASLGVVGFVAARVPQLRALGKIEQTQSTA
jgi:MFS family permease